MVTEAASGTAVLARGLDEPLAKRFRRGTHRLLAPADTLARVRPLAGRMGITRLGNITGLDRIGIPVAMAVRPNSRSVSVSQGKGLDLPQAMASALMEACEGFLGEAIGPLRRAAYRKLVGDGSVLDPGRLRSGGTPFDPAATIDWIEGWDLLRREPCWVPAEIVHTDFSREPSGCFLAGSNGLASGNHRVEAILAALCELVERDAVALWQASGVRNRAARRLDPASVDDPDCRALFAKYERAGIAVRTWNVTTGIGIPTFLCQIRDRADGDPCRLCRFLGSGCHPDPAIALIRALTEAAQTRLTYIAGARDDLAPNRYEEPATAAIDEALLDALAGQGRPTDFRNIPGFAGDDLAEDLHRSLARLAASRIDRVVAVDLTSPEFPIAVVRVVIPGLEWDPHHPDYRPGPRARAAVPQ